MQFDEANLGRITSVNGSAATALLARPNATDRQDALTVGHLVGICDVNSLVVGAIVRMSTAQATPHGETGDQLEAQIDFMGEVRNYNQADAFFQRGVSNYPSIGNPVVRLTNADISVVHKATGTQTIHVGNLRLDESLPAVIDFQELLCKHFAVLGTTGVGKSTTVALLLQEILAVNADLRVFLIDPHNEYGSCFGDQAHVVSPKNLHLPFWLFNFEEAVDVIFRGRPGVEEETDLLQELIPIAKARFAAHARGQTGLRRIDTGGYTADTPVPYRMSDLVELINDEVGKLENRSVRMKYHRLIGRIEMLGNDSRYTFMFSALFVQDIMADILSELFRLPANGKPLTVMHLAGIPAEVVDSVVSVLCRMAFEFGIWSKGAAPILVACEEAHRYATADRKLGFGPTRKALSRIAKEGRKYGIYLGVITQRPADLDPAILSQCSTVLAMRLSNERDKAIIRSAVPDAGAGLIDFLSSLGNREAIAFGEGVPLPTRIRFKDLPTERIPYSSAEREIELSETGVDRGFLDAVVERWRDASTSNARSRQAESAAVPVPGPGSIDDLGIADEGLGAPLIKRRAI
ncbi:MAG: ATP-binding protein [Alphaproteobacteria bacterium]